MSNPLILICSCGKPCPKGILPKIEFLDDLVQLVERRHAQDVRADLASMCWCDLWGTYLNQLARERDDEHQS